MSYNTAQNNRTLNKRIKRKNLNEDDGDNVIIEKTNVSPKDLNRKKFDS